MKNEKSQILVFTAIQGHLSLAEAVVEILNSEQGYNLEVSNLFGQEIFWSLYRFIYRFFPIGIKLPFYLVKTQKSRQLLYKYFHQMKGEEIETVIRKYQPLLIVNTYFGYIPTLDLLRKKYEYRYINIISDPISINPFTLSREADYNLAFDETAVKIGQEVGIEAKRIKTIGWLTRPQFYQRIGPQPVRRRLGFQKTITFLVCGGSEGNGAVLNTLPSLLFAHHPHKLQLIFISGTNKRLRQLIKQANILAKKLGFQETKMVNLGFTHKMADYMAISDLVIGKAGPNLLFESVARQKPFVAISHISGQESGNLDLIKKYKLGWVAEDPLSFNRLIKKLLKNPQLISQKKKDLQPLYLKNKRAITAFRQLVNQLLS